MEFSAVFGIGFIVLIAFILFVMMERGAEAAKQVLFSTMLALCALAAILPLAWILSVILVKGIEGLPFLAGSKIFTFLILILFGPIVMPFAVGLLFKAIRRIKAVLRM